MVGNRVLESCVLGPSYIARILLLSCICGDMDFQKYQSKVPFETGSRKGPNSFRDLA